MSSFDGHSSFDPQISAGSFGVLRNPRARILGQTNKLPWILAAGRNHYWLPLTFIFLLPTSQKHTYFEFFTEICHSGCTTLDIEALHHPPEWDLHA
tara:strand:- start:38599 stop:38886 length:288 start_codon:yes stop_codon:yes gene_type:complete